MNFGQAVQSVLKQYANFKGRARRSEFWWFYLFSIIVCIVGDVIDLGIGKPIFQIIFALALILPTLAVGCRRLHDIDRSGGWLWIAFVPIVGIILLIVWWCKDSQPAQNRFGQSPKYGGGGGGYGPGYGQQPEPPYPTSYGQ